MGGGSACDEGLAGLSGMMDWERRLGTVGRLECPSPYMVARWEVRTCGQSVGRVGPRTGYGGPLWSGGNFERRRGGMWYSLG